MKSKLQLFLIVLVIAVILLILPYSIRHLKGNSAFIGEDSYYHARIAKQTLKNRIQPYDEFVYGSRPYNLNPYHLLLAGAGYIFGIGPVSKFLPVALGVISAVMLYLILGYFRLKIQLRTLILILWILSPIFIYTFTLSNPYSFLIPLNLIGTYLFLRKSKITFLLSILVFIIIPFFGLYHSIIPIMVLLFLSLKKKDKLRRFYIILTVILIITLFYNIYLFSSHNYLQNSIYVKPDLIRNSISDLGGDTGFGIFNLVLLLIGIFIMWSQRREYYSAYYSILILLILYILIDFNFIIYLNLLVAGVGAFGLFKLLKMKWELKIIKTLTQVLIMCGLLFSTVSYINREVSMEPNNEIVNSLLWLKNHSEKGDIILSHESNGFWIGYISERVVFLDELTARMPEADNIYNTSAEVFYSRNLLETTKLLNKSKISYIWIDNKMKSGEVWTKQRQGLLFLFRNNETFKKSYNSTGIEIWEFLKRGD